MTPVDLRKERKKMVQAAPVVFIFWPIDSCVSAAISGIVPGLPNGEWYSINIAFFYLKLNIIFWCILILGGVYRYVTGRTPVIIGILFANVLAVFLGGVAINLITPSLQDWRWVIPLVLMYPVVSVLPFINSPRIWSSS